MNKKILQNQLLINAKQGNANAQYLLGLTYYVQSDINEALKWLYEAAAQGIVEAQDFIMFNNQADDDSESMIMVDLFLKAADGELLAEYLLGLIYYQGQKISKWL